MMSNHLELVVTELLIGQTITIRLLKEQRLITGLVLNETRNTLIILDQHDNIRKIIPKTGNALIERFYKGKIIQISGLLLKGRLEERIKAEPNKKW